MLNDIEAPPSGEKFSFESPTVAFAYLSPFPSYSPKFYLIAREMPLAEKIFSFET
jgi:hypothetical protein